jgi:hypothetical protein
MNTRRDHRRIGPKKENKVRNLILGVSAVVLVASAAQTVSAQPSSDATQPPVASSANQAGVPTAATIGPGGVTSSPTPADQAYKLKAGEPNVISNGPVADTPQNRRLYGGPMSNAGRQTAPIGD